MSNNKRTMTLPTDSAARKQYPLLSGVLRYFPAALAGVARISKIGNDKHNPGQAMHHARSKSMDHGDCIIRHLIDVQDLLAAKERGELTPHGLEELLMEVSSLAWRALALSQELHEAQGAPLAPGAVVADGNLKSGAALAKDVIHETIRVGTKVRVNAPHDSTYHGMRGVVIEIVGRNKDYFKVELNGPRTEKEWAAFAPSELINLDTAK